MRQVITVGDMAILNILHIKTFTSFSFRPDPAIDHLLPMEDTEEADDGRWGKRCHAHAIWTLGQSNGKCIEIGENQLR